LSPLEEIFGGMTSTKDTSLIERMGGAEAASGLLISAVEIFYYKLLADEKLAPFFEGKDMVMLKKKQVDFLAYVFGGPTEYSGKGIFEAHEHLIREQGTQTEQTKTLLILPI